MNRTTISITFIILLCFKGNSCTIFSGIDSCGEVWFGNNEDFLFSFKNYINVFPKENDTNYGYYTLSRDTPLNGTNAFIAGGMNEAGLTFDFNTVDYYEVKDMHKKVKFPKGDDAILPHILAQFETVEQVAEFFNKYWFEFGFRSAQMHLTDRFGHFAIISPTGSKILTDKQFQITTNYDICSAADGSSCWRFPIATELLSEKEPGLDTFIEVASKTANKGATTTSYTSINNATTKDIWFFHAGDYSKAYKTNLNTMLGQGRKSYLINDFFPEVAISKIYKAYKDRGIQEAYTLYKALNIAEHQKENLLANLVYSFIRENYNYDIYPFLCDYLSYETATMDLWLIKGIIEYKNGDLKRANQSLDYFLKKYPEQEWIKEDIVKRLKGEPTKASNTKITLEGYQDARNVVIKSYGFLNAMYPIKQLAFMTKQGDIWTSSFHLDKGIYNYSFVVDGEEILDANTPIRSLVTAANQRHKAHQIVKGYSEESHTIEVELEVPNIEDVVYVIGNQESVFPFPIVMMKKISDTKRHLKVNVHYPAKLRFVTALEKQKAVIEDAEDGVICIDEDQRTSGLYKVSSWN